MRRGLRLAHESETEVRLANAFELIRRDAELQIIFRARPRSAHGPAFAIVRRGDAENESAERHIGIFVHHLENVSGQIVETPGIRGEFSYRLQPLPPDADVALARNGK